MDRVRPGATRPWPRPGVTGSSSGLVAEAGVKAPDLVQRAAHRTREQVSDPALQDGVGGQPDHIGIVLRFQEFVDRGEANPASARK